MSVSILPATIADVSALAEIVIAAYQDDALYHAIFKDPTNKTVQQRKEEETIFRETLFTDILSNPQIHLFKALLEDTGTIVGFADFLTPKAPLTIPTPTDTTAPKPSTPSFEMPDWLDFDLLQESDDKLTISRNGLLGPNHAFSVWKVRKVVVAPAYRRCGVGRKLLEKGLNLVDGEGRDVFCHSTGVARKLFGGSGFEVLGSVEVFPSYDMVAMIRKGSKS